MEISTINKTLFWALPVSAIAASIGFIFEPEPVCLSSYTIDLETRETREEKRRCTLGEYLGTSRADIITRSLGQSVRRQVQLETILYQLTVSNSPDSVVLAA
jgi:hypothetical protein